MLIYHVMVGISNIRKENLHLYKAYYWFTNKMYLEIVISSKKPIKDLLSFPYTQTLYSAPPPPP